VDHRWALVRAGRAGVGSLLDLATALARERDADVLTALARPLGFLVDALVPDAAPASGEALRARLAAAFGPELDALGLEADRGETDAGRPRPAALPDLVRGRAGRARAPHRG